MVRCQLSLGAVLTALTLLACSQPPDSEVPTGPSAAKAPIGLSVKAVDPDSVPQDTTLDIKVSGSGFDASADAAFLLNGQPDPRVHTNSTRFVSSTALVANVSVAINAVPDQYGVQVALRSTGKKGIGTELLTVLPMIDLGTFGGTRASAGSVNDEGSVTGRADTTGNLGRVFVWDARTGGLRNLGPLEAIAINNARTVVGLSLTGVARWLYDSSSEQWSAPQALVGGNPSAGVSDINQLGQIVGAADSIVPGVGGGPALWQSPTQITPLDPTGRWPGGGAMAINNGGQVVGYGRRGGVDTGWVWVPDVPNGSVGRIVVLPAFTSAPSYRAAGINDAGDIVGWAVDSRGTEYALLWRRNTAQNDPTASNYYQPPVDLGASRGWTGRASDINNASVVVGRTRQSSRRPTDPFVWDPVNGIRILPKPQGGDAYATRLNESTPAIATGNASVNGEWHAIRWQLP